MAAAAEYAHIFNVGVPFVPISALIQLTSFGLAIKSVPEETRNFLELIQRVNKDLEEAQRKRDATAELLRERDPAKGPYIDGCIRDADLALRDIGALVEGARVDQRKKKSNKPKAAGEEGSVSFGHRLQWVLDNKAKVAPKEQKLRACHASVLQAIASMELFEQTAQSTPSVINNNNIYVDAQVANAVVARLRPPSARKPRTIEEPMRDIREVDEDELSTASDSQGHNLSRASTVRSFTASKADFEPWIEEVDEPPEVPPKEPSKSASLLSPHVSPADASGNPPRYSSLLSPTCEDLLALESEKPEVPLKHSASISDLTWDAWPSDKLETQETLTPTIPGAWYETEPVRKPEQPVQRQVSNSETSHDSKSSETSKESAARYFSMMSEFKQNLPRIGDEQIETAPAFSKVSVNPPVMTKAELPTERPRIVAELSWDPSSLQKYEEPSQDVATSYEISSNAWTPTKPEEPARHSSIASDISPSNTWAPPNFEQLMKGFPSSTFPSIYELEQPAARSVPSAVEVSAGPPSPKDEKPSANLFSISFEPRKPTPLSMDRPGRPTTPRPDSIKDSTATPKYDLPTKHMSTIELASGPQLQNRPEQPKRPASTASAITSAPDVPRKPAHLTRPPLAHGTPLSVQELDRSAEIATLGLERPKSTRPEVSSNPWNSQASPHTRPSTAISGLGLYTTEPPSQPPGPEIEPWIPNIYSHPSNNASVASMASANSDTRSPMLRSQPSTISTISSISSPVWSPDSSEPRTNHSSLSSVSGYSYTSYQGAGVFPAFNDRTNLNSQEWDTRSFRSTDTTDTLVSVGANEISDARTSLPDLPSTTSTSAWKQTNNWAWSQWTEEKQIVSPEPENSTQAPPPPPHPPLSSTHSAPQLPSSSQSRNTYPHTPHFSSFSHPSTSPSPYHSQHPHPTSRSQSTPLRPPQSQSQSQLPYPTSHPHHTIHPQPNHTNQPPYPTTPQVSRAPSLVAQRLQRNASYMRSIAQP